jgi:tricarballylate dehydrogenase
MKAHSVGAQVIVLDRLKRLRNNTYFSGGGSLEKRGSSKTIVEAARRTGQGRVDLELWRAFAEKLDESIEWLQGIGVLWDETLPVTGQALGDSSRRRRRVRGGGPALMATMEGAAKALRIPIKYQHRVSALKRDGRGGIIGIRAEHAGKAVEISSDAVVLASGGFQGNKEMISRYIGPWLTKLKLSGSPSNAGDGHIMALEAGAALTHIDQFHPSLRNRRRVNPFPRLQYGSILVNTEGRRFVDEIAFTKDVLSKETAQQPEGAACVIFDGSSKEIMSEGYEIHLQEHVTKGIPRVPPGSLQSIEGHIVGDGTLVRAATLGELAEKLSLPHEELQHTIEDYNKAISSGKISGLEIPRSGYAHRLDDPPFYGERVTSRLNCTLGGIKIDSHCRVVTKSGEIIPSLYACGEIVGGFFHENYQMVCGYLPICLVLGHIAGENAAVGC